MNPFLVHEGRQYYHVQLAAGAIVELPFDDAYPCLLWDHEGSWGEAERGTLIASLLSTNCRYAVCGGLECERWHDDIDSAFIAAVPENEQDARFIMTSWHTNEIPLAVSWFFAWNTAFDDHDFRRFLLLEIGQAPEPWVLQNALRRAVTECDAVVDELGDD